MGSSSKKPSHDDPRPPEGIIAQAEAVAAGTGDNDKTQPVLGGADLAIGDDIAEEAPLPPYDGTVNSVNLSQEGLDTNANVASDGRVNIRFDQKSDRLSSLLVPALRSQLNLQKTDDPDSLPPGYVPPSLGGIPGEVPPPPPLNVVIHVIGSRGDVQPFVALGQVLQRTYRHRVRLATHPVFRDFVEENGLEFFSIGGDPAELMAFMVKNPGLMPGKDSLRSGDIGKRRKGMYEIVRGCWRSCFEAGDGTGPAVSDNQQIEDFNVNNRPFVADAIIANPPSFAHVHIAEKLGVPLHLMFTMPWSPTQAFPHPLANIQSSNADASMTNFLSYAIVEMMTWQGLGDIINRFRESVLGLEPIELIQAPVLVSRLKIPYTYCWSPALIPKPQDWGRHISVSGFYFLPLADNYRAAENLSNFLDSGPPPVYIGFGSIVLDDPNGMTKLIFDAIKKTGHRALVSKGWGGVGADKLGIPDSVFMLGNVPHDWLFKHVSCVVHHGGAGTTAAGIALSKPTVIVPFFGDQPFWGAMIAKAGAGPEPIPHKSLTADNLAEAIDKALLPETQRRAQELGESIASEQGSDFGAKSFHDVLNVDSLRCSLAPSRTAIWQVKNRNIKLSGLAAAVLGKEGLLDFSQLRLFRYKEYDAEDGPLEPISGAASALIGTISGLMMGVADVPMDIFKSMSHKGSKSDAASASKKTISQENDTRTISTNTSKAFTGNVSEHDTDQSESQQSSTAGKSKASPPARGKSPSPSKEGTVTDSASRDSRGVTLTDAIGAGKGFGRVVDAGIKSPMDFTLSLAKGFHNAPRLYGDTSVRPHEHITGFQSGLKAAGKEFGFGFYDGISGLVTQPLEGAKKGGVSGLAKGFGKGIGGLVLKPAAAIWGLPGYTFKGLYKELVKRLGSSVQNYIIAARIAQGYEDSATSTPEERRDLVQRWQSVNVEAASQSRKRAFSRSSAGEDVPPPASTDHVEQMPAAGWVANSGDEVFDEAIKESVAATSTGNEEEDKWIARAIKASVTELRQASKEDRDEESLQTAVNASLLEAERARSEQQEHKARQQPSQPGPSQDIRRNKEGESDFDNPGTRDNADIDTDDDENIREALERSKLDVHQDYPADPEMKQAIAESLRGAAELDTAQKKAEEEERIVLEYVKRQSEYEQQYRDSAGK